MSQVDGPTRTRRKGAGENGRPNTRGSPHQPEGSDKMVLHIQKGKKKLKYSKEVFIKEKMLESYVDPGSEAVALWEKATQQLGLEYRETSHSVQVYSLIVCSFRTFYSVGIYFCIYF